MPTYEISGLQLFLPDDILTPSIQKMLEKGWYEIEEARALRAHLRDDDRVLELGGGAGFLASLCALRVGAENVTTVEANPAMLPVIQDNLDRNQQSAVLVKQGVVLATSANKAVEFFVPEAFWAGTSLKSKDANVQTVSVPVLLFDDLLMQQNPTVLIVDVEGAEQQYFGAPLPESLRLIVIELHPDRYGQDVVGLIFSRLANQGFIYQPKGSQGAVVVFEKYRA